MYAGRNYGNMNISKAAGEYWQDEEDIREYATLYSPLSDYRKWENVCYLSDMKCTVVIWRSCVQPRSGRTWGV